jgi:ribosomal protein S12 methylthiotransferase
MKHFEPVGIVSLGCPKNIVDSERILGKLIQHGFSITFDVDQARSVIINTCAFLSSAREESESVIKEFLDKKRAGRVSKVIVSGCYPSLVKKKLLQKFPELDAITGTNNLGDVENALLGKGRIFVDEKPKAEELARLQITLPHYEYLKIADGCNHKCAFCLIPKIKGPVHSFDKEFLVSEAESLAENGVKELILIAQDTTQYGIDIYGKNSLVDLLQLLNNVDGIDWIRILYTYPSEISDELIEFIASNSKIVPYIDVPIQHINDTILRRMRRIGSRKDIETLIDKLKSRNIAIRTTVIVGFPGEGEKEFNELVQFVKDVKFEHLGVFPFFREKGTESYSLDGQVSREVKIERQNLIQDIQHKINVDKLSKMVGTTVETIVDYFDEEINAFVGRTVYDAPEIDDFVILTDKDIEEGRIYKAKIYDSDEEKLFAKVIK